MSDDLETITKRELIERGAVFTTDKHDRPYAKISEKDKPVELYRPMPGAVDEYYCFSVCTPKEGAD